MRVRQLIGSEWGSILRRSAASMIALCFLLPPGTGALSHAQEAERTLYCGQKEHIHTGDCWEAALICGQEERELVTESRLVFAADFRPHVHSENCRNSAGEITCGITEGEYVHAHNAYCYDAEGKLVCGLERKEPHVHTEACYTAARILSCGRPEDPGHTHTNECYVTHQDLICGQEEDSGHTHTDECYLEHAELACGRAEEAGHTHTDACYAVLTEGKLTCGREESVSVTDEEGNIIREGHVHSGDCYTAEEIRILTCEQTEREGHTHMEACYTVTRELICDEAERAGHIHAEECYAERTERICGQEERDGHIHTETCYETEMTLTCGRTEGGKHHHSAACYDADGIHVHCGEAEVPVFQSSEDDWIEEEVVTEGHQHTEECRGEPVLICGWAEHAHTEECYVNPEGLPAGNDGEEGLSTGNDREEDLQAGNDGGEGLPTGNDREEPRRTEAGSEPTPAPPAEDHANSEETAEPGLTPTPSGDENTNKEETAENVVTPTPHAENNTNTETPPETEPTPPPSAEADTGTELYIEIIDEDPNAEGNDETETGPKIIDYSDTPMDPLDAENPEDGALEPYTDPELEVMELFELEEGLLMAELLETEEESETLELAGMEESLEMADLLEAEEEPETMELAEMEESLEMADPLESEEELEAKESDTNDTEVYTLTFQVEDYRYYQEDAGGFALVNGVYVKLSNGSPQYLIYESSGQPVPAGTTVYYLKKGEVELQQTVDPITTSNREYYASADKSEKLIWAKYYGGTANRYNREKVLQTIKTITAPYGTNISSYFPITGTNGITYTGYMWDRQGSSIFDAAIISLETMPAENTVFKAKVIKPSSTTHEVHFYYYTETLDSISGTVTWKQKNFEVYQHIYYGDASVFVSDERVHFVDLKGFEKYGSDPEYGSNHTVLLNQYNYTLKCYYLRKTNSITFMDGVYVDGEGNPTEEENRGKLSESGKIAYEADISSYNMNGSNYYAPVYDGYTFKGWYQDASCEQPCTFDTMSDSGITVYAKWQKINDSPIDLPPVAPTGFESDIAPFLWMVLGSILLFLISRRAHKGGGAG